MRSTIGVPDLSASWVQVLLLVAERPGQPLASIEQEVGLRTSSAQRIVLALGRVDRFGNPGLGLVEDVADPRHGTRKLYFLTEKGRSLITDVLTALMDEQSSTFATTTAAEFLARCEAEQAAKPVRVNVKAYTPQEVATGKRSLLRKGIKVGQHIVAFPLIPASKIIDEIDEWVADQGGVLHRLPGVSKPDGMAIADLPDEHIQFYFHMRWRQ
ncbi:MarR family winged helix-turn-helix transcriptional regulator [Methylorubrum extorquens]